MDYYNYCLALPFIHSHWSSVLVTKVLCTANTHPPPRLMLLSEKVFKTQTKMYVSYSFFFLF